MIKMMKNSALLLLFFLSLITGCKSPNEPASMSGEFFPLAVGNKWYYNTNHPDTTSVNLIQEITGQKVISKKNYYEMASLNLLSGVRDTFYYRLNGDTLFVRNAKDGEHILADFSLNLNDAAYWQQDLKVTAKTDEFITFQTPWGPDYGYSVTFKRGVGIINSAENGLVYYRTKLIKSEIK